MILHSSPTEDFPEAPGRRSHPTLDVFLVDVGDGAPVFYSEVPEPPFMDDDRPASGGILRRLETKYRHLRETLTRFERRIGGRTRRVLDWLAQFIAPDEAMLRRLRKTGRIVVHHPTTLAPEEAREHWDDYLARRRRDHIPSLVLNLLISPLAVLLTPIPGPNVVGYWFFYRAICHALALLGIRQAKGSAVSTQTYRSVPLDTLLDGVDEDRAGLVAAQLGLNDPGAFVRRVRREPSRAGGPPGIEP